MVDPPQHLVEMRRSAISLVQGSYVEEDQFQDDVLVYSLVAQRDSHAPRANTHSSRTHAHPHQHTHQPGCPHAGLGARRDSQTQEEVHTHGSRTHAHQQHAHQHRGPHRSAGDGSVKGSPTTWIHKSSALVTVQSARLRPRKTQPTNEQSSDSNTHSLTANDAQRNSDTHSFTNNLVEITYGDPLHTVNPPPVVVQSARMHSRARTHHQVKNTPLTNGICSETTEHNNNHGNAHSVTSKECVQNGVDHNVLSHLDYNYHSHLDYNSQHQQQHPQDFVSQCLELFRSLEQEPESIMGEEEFRERVQRLTFALREEAEEMTEEPEWSFEDEAQPEKVPEGDLSGSLKQSSDAPFTGRLRSSRFQVLLL